MKKEKSEILAMGAANLHSMTRLLVNDREQPRLSPADVAGLLANKNTAIGLYEAAGDMLTGDAKSPMTLTHLLSHLLGTEGEMNGLELMLSELGIRVSNDIENGVYAGDMNLFFATPAGTALVPEFISQKLREVAQREWNLNGLVAERVFTPNGTFRQPYLDLTNIVAGMSPVEEGGDLPEIKLAFSEASKTIAKRGCQFLVSYEAVKHVAINLFLLALDRIGYQMSLDDSAKLVAALVNGSTGQAKSVFAAAGDANDSHSIVYETWLNFISENSGRVYSKVLGTKESIIKVLLMAKSNVDIEMALRLLSRDGGANMGEITGVQNKQWSQVDLAIHPNVPAWTLIAEDPRYAVVQVSEIGADISETARVIEKQLNRLTMSKREDFFVFDASSIRRMTNL